MTAPAPRPPQKRLPFIIGGVVLAAAFVGILWWGLTHGEATSALLMLAMLLAIAAGLFAWMRRHP